MFLEEMSVITDVVEQAGRGGTGDFLQIIHQGDINNSPKEGKNPAGCSLSGPSCTTADRGCSPGAARCVEARPRAPASAGIVPDSRGDSQL